MTWIGLEKPWLEAESSKTHHHLIDCPHEKDNTSENTK